VSTPVFPAAWDIGCFVPPCPVYFLPLDGTLFLDEITEMSPEAQSKLLRVLEGRAVKPIGEVDEAQVDFRIIASTNRVPQEVVRAGQLRQDLLYRLQKIQFHLPPLRERYEDLPLLIDHFIALFSARLELAPPYPGVERKALRAMRRYQWPGNVRESPTRSNPQSR
jgi:transcriptional regulator with PAS, ATPase and Fis domain